MWKWRGYKPGGLGARSAASPPWRPSGEREPEGRPGLSVSLSWRQCPPLSFSPVLCRWPSAPSPGAALQNRSAQRGWRPGLRAQPSMAAPSLQGLGLRTLTRHSPRPLSSVTVHQPLLSAQRLDLPGQVALGGPRPSRQPCGFGLSCGDSTWRPSSLWRLQGPSSASCPRHLAAHLAHGRAHRVSQGHEAAGTCVRGHECVLGRVSVTLSPWHGGCLR